MTRPDSDQPDTIPHPFIASDVIGSEHTCAHCGTLVGDEEHVVATDADDSSDHIELLDASLDGPSRPLWEPTHKITIRGAAVNETFMVMSATVYVPLEDDDSDVYELDGALLTYAEHSGCIVDDAMLYMDRWPDWSLGDEDGLTFRGEAPDSTSELAEVFGATFTVELSPVDPAGEDL